MKIIATIEARMASSRLPGKILKPVLETPMLFHLIDRVKKSKLIQDIVVATTIDPSDDITVSTLRAKGVKCFRGSSGDVMERVLRAAQANQADIIVELTGDCPLIHANIIDPVIQHYLNNKFDYVSNILERTYPRGMDTQVFSTKVLETAASLTNDPADRENVSLYIYEHSERFSLSNVAAPSNHHRPDLRLTVDTKEDYDLISSIYDELYPKDANFSLTQIIELINKRPDLKSLNETVQQKKVR